MQGDLYFHRLPIKLMLINTHGNQTTPSQKSVLQVHKYCAFKSALNIKMRDKNCAFGMTIANVVKLQLIVVVKVLCVYATTKQFAF